MQDLEWHSRSGLCDQSYRYDEGSHCVSSSASCTYRPCGAAYAFGLHHGGGSLYGALAAALYCSCRTSLLERPGRCRGDSLLQQQHTQILKPAPVMCPSHRLGWQ